MPNNLIALDIKAPQVADPLEQYSRAAGIGNLIQQRQLHSAQIAHTQQQMQMGELKLQEEQRNIADDAAVRDSLSATGGDFVKAKALLATKGGVGQASWQKLDDHINKQADEVSRQDKAKRETNTAKAAAAYDALTAVDQLAGDPAKQEQLYNARQQGLVDAGMLSKDKVRPYAGPDDVKQQILVAATANQIHERANQINTEKAAVHKQAMYADQEKQAAATAISAQQKASGTELVQPAERERLDREAATQADLERHRVAQEKISQINAAVNQGHLAQSQMVNGMKYGPGTQEYWVKQLQDNPDSIKEMPAEFRSVVGQKFRQATGLPLPTALSGATQTQETAARNALDGIDFIKKALDNPEIRKNIGPIMGRLGNLEQRIGTAPTMSPEAEALAQELRTRMRYFVFQEGKAVLGGRLPQNLMKSLEESSANVKMDPAMLSGALNGAEGNAQSVMDNADKQRFGGAMRPRSMRTPTSTPSATGTIRARDTNGKLHEAPAGTPLPAGWKPE